MKKNKNTRIFGKNVILVPYKTQHVQKYGHKHGIVIVVLFTLGLQILPFPTTPPCVNTHTSHYNCRNCSYSCELRCSGAVREIIRVYCGLNDTVGSSVYM